MSTQKKTTRRVFMIQNAVASAAVLMAVDASAQTMVSESDPQAAALGYVADTNKVNKSKFPKHAATRHVAAACCTKVQRVRLLVVVGSSPANKFQRRAGAPRTTRKPDPQNAGEKKPRFIGAFSCRKIRCWRYLLNEA